MSAVCVRPLESVLDGAPRLDESTTTSPAPRAMTFISYQCGNAFSFFSFAGEQVRNRLRRTAPSY